MLTNAQYENLIEDNELAFFRADVCLGSPQSFTLEEKAAICDEMGATNKAIEDAIRKDFEALSPKVQAKMLDLLQQADPGNFAWWLETLVGEMPNTASALV